MAQSDTCALIGTSGIPIAFRFMPEDKIGDLWETYDYDRRRCSGCSLFMHDDVVVCHSLLRVSVCFECLFVGLCFFFILNYSNTIYLDGDQSVCRLYC